MQQHPESNRPWQRFTAFLHAESSGGLIMMCAALLALIAANSAIAPQYESVIHWPITLGFTAPLHLWVNDVGMVLFFLMIGMELAKPCGALTQQAADAGLLISVTADSVIRLVPSLILTVAEADEIVAKLTPLVKAILAE